jgi:NAD(P)-dependent dehydrogenase (short-subunit alcohol dehydrogenase family)
MNMLTVLYAQEYAKEGFTIFGISPGVSISTRPFYCIPRKFAQEADFGNR